MQSNLQILIDELQRECDYLEKEIKQCLDEWDYGGAEAFKEPLFFARAKLKVLKNLSDSHQDRKIKLEHRIRYYEEQILSKEFHEAYLARYEKEVMKMKQELIELDIEAHKFHIDSDVLIKTFHKLLSKKIDSFEIDFMAKRYLYDFTLIGDVLKIEISRTDLKMLSSNVVYTGLVQLSHMGFLVKERRATKEIHDFSEQKILQVIGMISKITYEIFEMYGNQSAIVRIKK